MKLFYEQYNIGKVKYLISYHDGIKKHDDGSDFYDVATFKNKKEFTDFKNVLINNGYKDGYKEGTLWQ
jgi:hypothetical protein